MVVAVIVIATLQEQAVVLVIGNGGGGQSTAEILDYTVSNAVWEQSKRICHLKSALS